VQDSDLNLPALLADGAPATKEAAAFPRVLAAGVDPALEACAAAATQKARARLD
jgi:hypothetical protein